MYIFCHVFSLVFSVALRWIDAFKDANGFRFSTYFVSYTSEATCLISGIGTMCKTMENTCNQHLAQNKIPHDTTNEDQNANDSKKVATEMNKTEHQESTNELTVSWLVQFTFVDFSISL